MKKLFIFTALLTLLLSACSSGTAATSASVVTPASSTSSTLFQIVKTDGAKFDVTLDAVKKLPLAQITVDGKVQEGPKLMDVLALAGVTDFTEVTFTGSSPSVTLTRAQVDDNTILDFANRGTMKLATTYIPMPNWTKDITEIKVK